MAVDAVEATESLPKETGLVGLDGPLDELDLTKMLAENFEDNGPEETSPSTATSAGLRIGGPIKTWSTWPSRCRRRGRPRSRSGGSQRDGLLVRLNSPFRETPRADILPCLSGDAVNQC
jgi:hypothetical protein